MSTTLSPSTDKCLPELSCRHLVLGLTQPPLPHLLPRPGSLDLHGRYNPKFGPFIKATSVRV